MNSLLSFINRVVKKFFTTETEEKAIEYNAKRNRSTRAIFRCEICFTPKTVDNFPILIRKYRGRYFCLDCLKEKGERWVKNYVCSAHRRMVNDR